MKRIEYSKDNVKRRYIFPVIFLGILLFSFVFSIVVSEAEIIKENVNINVKMYSKSIENGEKGISPYTSNINITWDNTKYTLNKDGSLGEIVIIASNDDQREESYKFDITADDYEISLRTKTYYTPDGSQRVYKLQESTLYTIYIPEGMLINSEENRINEDIYFDFVTAGDGNNDILLSTSPVNLQERIDTSDSIIFKFIDDISLNQWLSKDMNFYKSQYIDIVSLNLNTDLSDSKNDSVEDFTVSVDKNKLILKKNNGEKLNDFSKYIVRLKDETVFLKNSLSGVKIYNDGDDSSQWTTVQFKTNKIVEETSPINHEKNVELEPTIRIKFKDELRAIDSINILNNTKLKIKDDHGEQIFLNPGNAKVYLDSDKKTLVIELNAAGSISSLLRADTPYYFWMKEGVVKLQKDESIGNEEIVLNFTTVDELNTTEVISYSSSISLEDDITKMDSTELNSHESIYIGFDRAIKFDKDFEWDLDKGTYSDIEVISKYFQLYEGTSTVAEHVYSEEYNSELHIYSSKYIDTDGDDYMERYMLPEGITNLQDLEDVTKLKSLSIKKVQILQYEGEDRILKITPKNSLTNLNKYKLRVDRGIIEDLNGYNIKRDIEFSFWTKESSVSSGVSWERVEDYKFSDIEEDSPYFEMPRYGWFLMHDDSDIVERFGIKPIAIDIKGEIIPNRSEENLFKGLESIHLKDVYYHPDSGEIGTGIKSVNKIVTQYYIKDGERYTKLYIYPEQLKYGRRYLMTIPQNTFQSRSGYFLPELKFDFVVKSQIGGEMDILYLENGMKNVMDIAKDSWEIIARGYNFEQGIDKVEILDINELNKVEISSEDVEFKDVTTINIKIRDEKKDEFIDEFGAIDEDLKLKVIIYFSSGDYVEKEGLIITPRGNPNLIDMEPSDQDVWYDEYSINRKKIDGEYVYFLKVTFSDPDTDNDGVGELQVRFLEGVDGSKTYIGLSRLMEESSVTASGSSVSLINTDFIRRVIGVLSDENTSESQKDKYMEYIFEKNGAREEAYLYLPIKLLSSQTSYNVILASDVVVYPGSSVGNEGITWSFTTMADPVITDILVGSVVEDYDEDEPLIISGEFFYHTLEVYFNDIRAEDVEIEEDEDGNTYLEVYLPQGNDRLEPGIYNMYIENDENHVRELYGVFSVVREGERIPIEEYRLKETELGEVREDIKVSENTIILDSKYADDRYVEVDLDELMGSDVLVRRIVIEGDEDEKIGVLKTKSRWADIDLYNVRLDSDADDDEITLILGRADQVLKQALRKKLGHKAIKSEFIRVKAENSTLDRVVLNIPFNKANGKRLKVLKYDEYTRNFYMVKVSVDLVDREVTIESKGPGIFVVVED